MALNEDLDAESLALSEHMWISRGVRSTTPLPVAIGTKIGAKMFDTYF